MLLKIMILIAIAACVREHWGRLDKEDPEWNGLLRKWFAQGVLFPLAIWALINLGISDYFPALVPKIAIAQSKHKPWWELWVSWNFTGAGFIAICWAAVTYSWLILTIARKAGHTPEFRYSAAIVGLPLLALAFVMVVHGNWTQLPVALLILFMPLVHATVNTAEKRPPVLTYGAAKGKINFGKYEDAEIEVINQLEKKENDFQGWMMLAELYATKYRRFEDAAQVVIDICNDPTVTDVEASRACNKLADWQLEIAMNPPAARAALDLLIQRAPESHVARMAELRLKQMPRTREDLLDQKKPRAIRLPALREEFDSSAQTSTSRNEATLEANRLTERLRDDPNDYDARERLAIVLAEKLGQGNLGIEQLRLMIAMPEILGERAAKLMAQIASWERRLNKNETKFRALLAEIIRSYPNTTQAYSARRQLQLIENEEFEKAHPKSPAPAQIRLQVPEA